MGHDPSAAVTVSTRPDHRTSPTGRVFQPGRRGSDISPTIARQLSDIRRRERIYPFLHRNGLESVRPVHRTCRGGRPAWSAGMYPRPTMAWQLSGIPVGMGHDPSAAVTVSEPSDHRTIPVDMFPAPLTGGLRCYVKLQQT